MCYFDWQKSFIGLSEIGVNCSVYLYVLFVHVSLNVMHSYLFTYTQILPSLVTEIFQETPGMTGLFIAGLLCASLR